MDITLRAETGRSQGSRASRRLRREGLVPAVVYGQGLDPLAVAVDHHALLAALKTEAGLNAIINLDVEGGETFTTLAREIDRHPTKPEIRHLDFVQISLTEKVTADVGIDFEGEPAGVRLDGGIVETINSTVHIEALPLEIPSSIVVDITDLELHAVLTIADLPAVSGVEYLDDPDTPLLTISLPAAEKVEEEEEGLELMEGEEAPEGEEGDEEAADDAGDEG